MSGSTSLVALIGNRLVVAGKAAAARLQRQGCGGAWSQLGNEPTVQLDSAWGAPSPHGAGPRGAARSRRLPAPGASLRATSPNRSHSAARDVIQSGTNRGGCAFGELRINRNTQSRAGARRTIGHVVTCLPHVTRRGARITCWCPEDRAGGRDQAGRNRAALVTAHIPPGTGVEFC